MRSRAHNHAVDSLTSNRKPVTVPISDRHLQRPALRFGRCVAVAILGSAPFSVLAQSAPTAAEIDWRPRAQLPESALERLPVFCDGGYLPSGADGHQAGVGAMLGESGAGPAPIEASGLMPATKLIARSTSRAMSGYAGWLRSQRVRGALQSVRRSGFGAGAAGKPGRGFSAHR